MAKNMTKLDALYNIIESSKIAGIELNSEVLTQIAEMEEKLIKEEVLPVLRDNIEPVLRKIKRELTLVVDYRPDEPLTLRISRERNLSDLDDAVTLTPDDIPDFHKRNSQTRTGERKPNKSLRVTIDGETIYNEGNATETYCEVIKRIGLRRVRALEILASGINIVSTSNDPNRQQRKIDEFYVFTNCNTNKKADILKDIADKLGISLKVEVKDE